MRTRPRTLAVGLLFMALIAASCSDDDSSDTTAGTRRIDQPPATEAAATEAPAPARIDGQPGETRALRPAEPTYAEGEEQDAPSPGDTRFQDYGVNPPVDVGEQPISTFAVDVDTGAYTLMRAWVDEGFLPDPDAVRVEEYVNYFDYDYPAPEDGTFAVYADGGPTPFYGRNTELLRIGIKAREITERQRANMNLTLVVDTSGSMDSDEKLDVVKDALLVLIDELDRHDTVAIVAYSTDAEVALEPTAADSIRAIRRVVRDLDADGTTNAEAGLRLGYDLADEMFDRDEVNRVVLISDGVANVGRTGPKGILDRIGDRTRDGIDLVTIGVGIETYNDVLLEQLADQGDGWYAYIDTADEAERLFRDGLTTSLEAVARNVKVQVDFDDELVREYRLIGFENRELEADDFRDDSVDAGEVNAGHAVTALYELELTGAAYRTEDPFAIVRLRWEDADGTIQETEGDVSVGHLAERYGNTSNSFQVAATVAAYAEVLRHSPYLDMDLGDVLDEARELDAHDDDVDEFVTLVRRAARLAR